MGWVEFMPERVGASPAAGGVNNRADAGNPGKAAFSIRLHNLDEIRRAYGEPAAHFASRHVETVLNSQLRDREPLGQAEHLLRQLSEFPVAYDGQCFHLSVSLAPTGDLEGRAQKVAPTVHGNPAFPDDAWCWRYRADMALAVTLFDAMKDDRLVLAWQPVRNAEQPSDILYHECLLRIVTPHGAVESASDAIEALERLGMVRALDRFVAAEALGALRTDRTRRIAINVSAQSLVRDAWWSGLLDALDAEPALAARLYVEITETAPMLSVTQALDFVSVLRRYGCHIVIDDFGAGHASIRQLLAFKPEVVKIDRFFVHYAKASAQGLAALGHLIGLAESLGALPVIEGIETASESEMALQAGCCWQQGYHHGRPSVARPWGLDAGASQIIGNINPERDRPNAAMQAINQPDWPALGQALLRGTGL